MATGKRILIIDDDPDILASVSALLEQEQYETETAVNGDLGLQKARENVPDLVILDLFMPKKSGMKFLNEARGDETLKDVPVIIYSGASQLTGVDMKSYMEDQELRRRKAKVFGPDMKINPEAFLEKPADPDEILTTVKKFLGS
jgi:twitching motility two-component system response regulator PilH